MQMRHGMVSLLADDGVPDITVGAGWNEGTDGRYRARLPAKAIDQIVATSVPLVVENVAAHPMFTAADAAALGATEETRVSFIGVPIRIDSRVVGTSDHRPGARRPLDLPDRCRRPLPDHGRQSDRPDRQAAPGGDARPRAADGGKLSSAEGAVGAEADPRAQEGARRRHHRREPGDPRGCSPRSA